VAGAQQPPIEIGGVDLRPIQSFGGNHYGRVTVSVAGAPSSSLSTCWRT
jgi:hypothetical protein